jgi:hypothetical protein
MSYTASNYMSGINAVTIENPFSQHTEAAWVGPINASLSNTVTHTTSTFRTYCVDLLRDVGVPSTPTVYQGDMVSGTPAFQRTEGGVATSNGARAAYLYAKFNPGVTTVAQGVGLQLAIWSVIYNGAISTGDYGLAQSDGGQFWVGAGAPADAYADAKSYLQQSLGRRGDVTFYFGATNGPNGPGGIQWQMGGTNAFITPEPSTLAAAAIGGAFFVVLKRARRHKTDDKA